MKSKFKLRCFLAGSAFLAMISAVQAAPIYWDNNGTDSGFGTAGNIWSSAGTGNLWNTDEMGVEPVTANYTTLISDDIHFGTNTASFGLGAGTITVSGAVNAGSLTFGSQSGAITLSGAGSTINLASGGTISNNANSNSVISSALGGSGGFIVNSGGAGSIQFGTAISHLGSMRIDNGTVLMGNNGVTGNLTKIILNGSGANMRLSGGTFTFDEVFEVTENGGNITRGSNSGTLTGSFTATGTGNRTLTLRHDDTNTARSLTLSDSFVLADPSSGRLSMNKTGAGILNMGLANTYTGSTTITAGTLNLTNSSALQNSYIDTTNSVTGNSTNGLVNSGATLNLGGLLGSKDVSTLFKTGGGYGSLTALMLNVALGNDLSYSGAIGNGGGGLALTKTGTGTQVLTSVSNSYQGGTTVSNGILGFASGALGNTGNITVNGGTLRWESGNTQNVSSRIVMQNGGSATFNTNGNNVDFTAGIGSNSSSSLTKSGSGTLTLSGTCNYSGSTTVSQGTLALVGGSHTSAITVDPGASLGFTLDSPTTSTAALDLTTGTVKITGSVDNASDYLLMTASSIDGTPTLDTPIANYTLQKTVGDTQLKLVYNPGGNTPPTISDIADQSVPSGGNTGALAFTVSDAETAAGSLIATGSSSNTMLVPDANIVINGNGGIDGSRTVTVTPVSGLSGTATITVTVTDGGSLTSQDTFVLTVTDNYLSWATANNVTGGENGDSNNNGVSNLVEYALVDGGERGDYSGNTITFTKRGGVYGSDISYAIETSTDLGISDIWETSVIGVTDNATTISYTFTPSTTEKEFARLKVQKTP